MTDMVKRWLERDLWSINVKEMQKEIIDSRNVILALVGVVESIPEKAKWIDVHGNACFDSDAMSKLGEALTACEARIAEVLEDKEACGNKRCQGGKIYLANDAIIEDCPDCKEVCLDCGGWGMIHENVDCPAIGTFNECACSVPCPSCTKQSTYYHSDPTIEGREKRTQEED